MDVSIICDKRFSMIIWTNHETQYLENQITLFFTWREIDRFLSYLINVNTKQERTYVNKNVTMLNQYPFSFSCLCYEEPQILH